MPHVTVLAPMKPIVRYRCYACGEPWWVYLKTVKLQPGHNTLTALCKSCSDRFDEEGPFWKGKNGTQGVPSP